MSTWVLVRSVTKPNLPLLLYSVQNMFRSFREKPSTPWNRVKYLSGQLNRRRQVF